MEDETNENGDCLECLKATERARQKQFKEDMENAGFEPELYCGRFFYHGYAVRGDDEQDLIRATKIRLKTDGMGRGVIVYPD